MGIGLFWRLAVVDVSLVIVREFLVVVGGVGEIGFWRLVVWCCARGVVLAGCCLGAVFGVGENWLVSFWRGLWCVSCSRVM